MESNPTAQAMIRTGYQPPLRRRPTSGLLLPDSRPQYTGIDDTNHVGAPIAATVRMMHLPTVIAEETRVKLKRLEEELEKLRTSLGSWSRGKRRSWICHQSEMVGKERLQWIPYRTYNTPISSGILRRCSLDVCHQPWDMLTCRIGMSGGWCNTCALTLRAVVRKPCVCKQFASGFVAHRSLNMFTLRARRGNWERPP